MIIDHVAKIILAPVLAVQAIGVRNRALHLPEASGPRSGTLGSGPPLRLLIIGDSSAAGVGVATQSQALAGQLAKALSGEFAVHWTLLAKTGATTASTHRSIRAKLLPTTDIVVMALGVNDVTHAVPRFLWLRQQRALRDFLKRNTGARAI